MGLRELNRLMSVQRERRRRRRHGQNRDVEIALLTNGKDSVCQQDGSPQGCKRRRYSGPDLPEGDMGLNKNLHGKDEIARDFNSKVDQILKKHSGIGLKTFKIDFRGYNANADTYSYLNNWLEIAITPELKELTLHLLPNKAKYSFPCSLLSDGRGNSIQHLKLAWCTFRNTVGLYCLKNLTSLYLSNVSITGNELGSLLSNSTALELLDLSQCYKIVRLKIPCLLQRLSRLRVSTWEGLKMIENKAPNISSFEFSGLCEEFSLGESLLQLKDMRLQNRYIISFALAKLPLIVPNLEALSLFSYYEVPNPPMMSKTFLHLKLLSITLTDTTFSPDYDCFSAVSFLDAAPSLETMLLSVR